MKLNIARASALGTIGIGIMSLAFATGGCAAGGGDPAPGSSEQVGTSSQPVITPVSLTTGGCGAVGTFAVTSPQIISFIAANTSSFKNAQLQLYTTDSQNKLHQVNVTSQTASAQMQAMLEASSEQKASQSATLAQSSDNSAKSRASTKNSASEQDTTQVSGSQSAFANSETTVFHHDDHNASASGTASNAALSASNASNSASGTSGASNSANQNFFANAIQQGNAVGFFGGIAVIPVTSSSTTNQNNSTSAMNNAFFTNAAAAAQQAAALQSSAFNTSSHSDNTTLDKSDQDTRSGSAFSQTIMHSIDSSNASSADQSASNSSDLNASQSSSAAQSAKSNSLQSNSSSSSSQTQVLNDLDQFNSSKFVLVVNMTADQANSVLQLFQGSNGVVTGSQDFPISIPTCTGIN